MKNTEATWTTKQQAAYEALMASFRTTEARRINTPSILNKAPKSGWTDADRVPAK